MKRFLYVGFFGYIVLCLARGTAVCCPHCALSHNESKPFFSDEYYQTSQEKEDTSLTKTYTKESRS